MNTFIHIFFRQKFNKTSQQIYGSKALFYGDSVMYYLADEERKVSQIYILRVKSIFR